MVSNDSLNEAQKGDVFISHHSSQYGAARRVKAALAETGIRSWLAPDDVDPGSAFDIQIVDQLGRSDAIVLLLSPEADRSRHVKRELMLADDNGIAVFPVRLEGMQAEGLAYFLKDRQWIDWFGARGDGLERLVDAVRVHYAGPRPDRPSFVSSVAKRRRWPWIAGGIAALAAAGVAAWLLVPGLTGPKPVVRPGLWLNKREMIALTYPVKVAEEEARQLKSMVENDPNPEECISDEVARNPDVRLFDPGNKGKCALTGFQIGGGRMSGYLVCPIGGAKNATMSIVFQSTFSQESIVMESDITIAQPGATIRFKARDSSHWIAEKCNAENR